MPDLVRPQGQGSRVVMMVDGGWWMVEQEGCAHMKRNADSSLKSRLLRALGQLDFGGSKDWTCNADYGLWSHYWTIGLRIEEGG